MPACPLSYSTPSWVCWVSFSRSLLLMSSVIRTCAIAPVVHSMRMLQSPMTRWWNMYFTKASTCSKLFSSASSRSHRRLCTRALWPRVSAPRRGSFGHCFLCTPSARTTARATGTMRAVHRRKDLSNVRVAMRTETLHSQSQHFVIRILYRIKKWQ